MEQQQYLPPMRSIWNQPYSPPTQSTSINTNNNNNNNNTSSSTITTTTNTSDKINIERPSTSRPLHLLQFTPHQHENPTTRLPSFHTGGPREILMKEDANMYPPALDPSWPGSRYDATSFEQHEMIKRRKLSSQSPSMLDEIKKGPILSTPHQHVVNASPTTTDTYYHQSRRKKRDTKPPNANDIRPFVEVEKKDGHYVLPAEVDSWTVLNLGVVVWDRAAFHNQRYIYPVGYRVKK